MKVQNGPQNWHSARDAARICHLLNFWTINNLMFETKHWEPNIAVATTTAVSSARCLLNSSVTIQQSTGLCEQENTIVQVKNTGKPDLWNVLISE